MFYTTKLNADGHHCLGQLADFHFDARCQHTIMLPTDIDALMEKCSEELTKEAIEAVWEGSHRTQQKDIPWVATLNSNSQSWPTQGPLQAISQT